MVPLFDTEVMGSGDGVSFTALDAPPAVAMRVHFHSVTPNLFHPNSRIRFELPEKVVVRLGAFNMLAQRVATVFNGTLRPGRHRFTFSRCNLPSGGYFFVLPTPTGRQVPEAILLCYKRMFFSVKIFSTLAVFSLLPVRE